MNIQFVRLEDDVCSRVNDAASKERRTVSELVNEILRQYLRRAERPSAGEAVSK